MCAGGCWCLGPPARPGGVANARRPIEVVRLEGDPPRNSQSWTSKSRTQQTRPPVGKAWMLYLDALVVTAKPVPFADLPFHVLWGHAPAHTGHLWRRCAFQFPFWCQTATLFVCNLPPPSTTSMVPAASGAFGRARLQTQNCLSSTFGSRTPFLQIQ